MLIPKVLCIEVAPVHVHGEPAGRATYGVDDSRSVLGHLNIQSGKGAESAVEEGGVGLRNSRHALVEVPLLEGRFGCIFWMVVDGPQARAHGQDLVPRGLHQEDLPRTLFTYGRMGSTY